MLPSINVFLCRIRFDCNVQKMKNKKVYENKIVNCNIGMYRVSKKLGLMSKRGKNQRISIFNFKKSSMPILSILLSA